MKKLFTTLSIAGIILAPTAFAADETIDVVVEDETRLIVASAAGPQLPSTGAGVLATFALAGAFAAFRRK